MSAKKQSSRTDMVRDAATGYAVIVLGLLCFIVTLVVIMAGVRIVMSLGGTSTTANTTTVVTTTATTASSADTVPLAVTVPHRSV